MRNAALFLSVLIILGGVGWFLFNSVPAAEAPDHQDVFGHDVGDVSDSSDGDFGGDIEDWYGQVPPPAAVRSFVDCVNAGNPVMESYPRQCRHDGVLFVEDVAVPAPPPTEPIACTMEAKICPDGSAVGRSGPSCEFAPCPGETPPGAGVGDITYCSPESRLVDMCAEIYAPVCGQVQVQCITTPCDPIPETFPNSCFACMRDNVISYTEGACRAE